MEIMSDTSTWDAAVAYYQEAKNELFNMVKGLEDLESMNIGILQDSIKLERSMPALRDAELSLNRVDSVRFKAGMLSYELKVSLNASDKIKADCGTNGYLRINKLLKLLKEEVDLLRDIINDKYKHTWEVAFETVTTNKLLMQRQDAGVSVFNYKSSD